MARGEVTNLSHHVAHRELTGLLHHVAQGEVTIVVEGAAPAEHFWAVSNDSEPGTARGSAQSWGGVFEEVQLLMQGGASVMSASRTVAKKYGLPRGRVQARVQSLLSGQDTISDVADGEKSDAGQGTNEGAS